MQEDTPLILVTNDDGITAPGIRNLISIMNEIGQVVVVAPDKPQSGTSHSVTVRDILRIRKQNVPNNSHIEYSCSGTPADCVKIAKNEILDRKPDLCVSGINHGSNAAINVIYSGTMSAAIEAGIEGMPSIGFSLMDKDWNADFKPLEEYIRMITKTVLKQGIPSGTVLNVNFPKIDNIKGVRVCRQCKGSWKEVFERRVNPAGDTYYWLDGEFVNWENTDNQDTDISLLDSGYATVVPVKFDMTDYNAIPKLDFLNINSESSVNPENIMHMS
ncbi:5'/3'-nucleotidase SurE [Ichthyobacterium seriolicida]|nr:5'/3'-nucleotidase SurE [Ichthyobacterium seriolicida]